MDHTVIIFAYNNFNTAKYHLQAYDTDNKYSLPTADKQINYRIHLGKRQADIGDAPSVPADFALYGAHPNPFNPSTTLRYDLPEESRVSLTIYDIMGREVWQHAALEAAGYKAMTWVGEDESGQQTPSGIYIYRLTAISLTGGEPFVASRKMLLLK